MATTVLGMKYSDQLAALLDHALANGWRIEPNPREKPNGAIAYPPDKDHQVIRFSEKGGKFNRAHYENVRREFYRAGLPPLPADAKEPHVHIVEVGSEEDVRLLAEGKHAVTSLKEVFAALAEQSDNGLLRMMEDPTAAGPLIGILVEGLAMRAGCTQADANHVSLVCSNTINHYLANRVTDPAEVEAKIAAAAAQVEASLRKDIDESLRMASDAEARADREQKAAERAEAARVKAAADCANALRRAEAAEAKAAELDRAIAPLRGLLNAGS